jgi:hypothetical protein
MTDYRRHYDEAPRRSDRDWLDRSDESRSWFRDGGETHRTDDRDYHDRHRHERVAGDGDGAANEYYRAARDQRDAYTRWSHGPENWGDQHLPDTHAAPSWGPRERGGYWRQYESARPHFVGRGPKGYQRSDDRIKEEICDCMTEDAVLDASEVEVDVRQGEVTLTGSVTSREQKRRAEDVAERISGVRDVTNQLRVTREGIGHSWAADARAAGPGMTSAQPVSEAAGKGTPSKSTSGTSA